jgi:glutamate 5-kinase
MKQRIVVKIGSLGVSSPQGGVDEEKITRLTQDILALKAQGHELVLVSSGAINAGRPFVPKPDEKQLSLAWQQSCAAVGMPLLMNAYHATLKSQQVAAAQVLVTHDDFKARPRFLNVRNTLLTLLQSGVLPIVNENDTVSTREITVGDNDQLAAMVAESIGADRLILLTDADGLYDRDPRDPEAQHFSVIDFREDFAGIKVSSKTSVGRGGMLTKLMAVRRLTPVGLDVTIATFNDAHPVSRALSGGGTLFKGDPREKVKKRLSWIASVARPSCAIVVDEGAAKALKGGKASLLPVGIKKVSGTFRRGDVIAVKYQQKTVALGIVEYDAKEIERIKGKKSSELKDLFDVVPSHVVIHRDNLFLPKD